MLQGGNTQLSLKSNLFGCLPEFSHLHSHHSWYNMIILNFQTVALILKLILCLPLCAPASEWTPGWTASGTPPHWGKQCPSVSLVTLSSRGCCGCRGRPVRHSDRRLHPHSRLLWPRDHKWKVKAWSGRCRDNRRRHAHQDSTQLSAQHQCRPFQNAKSAD